MVSINKNENLKLDAVFTKIMNLDRVDFAVPAAQASVVQETPESDFTMLMQKPVVEQYSDINHFPMTVHAREQLNSRWSGFNTFSRTLDKDGRGDLYMRTVNDLLEHDERKLMIRTVQQNGQRMARAVVSDAFKPIDDNLIVPDMRELMGHHSDDWRSLGGNITDTNTFIRFITRDPQITLNMAGRDRALHIGFQYSNSEVGRGCAQFKAFFFDSFCENGCVFGQKTVADVKYAHRGTRISTDFGRIFEERIRKSELAQIQGAILDATTLAVKGAYVPEMKQLLQDAIDNKIPEGTKISDFISLIGKNVGLTEHEQEETLVHYDGNNSQFGVLSAITALAQDASTYSRRIELEEAGGKVMAVSKKQWNSIAALAA